MNRLMGLETEYGIAVEGLNAGDLVKESTELVSAYVGACFHGWNYGGESPRRDLRGFSVNQLTTNPDDAQFDSGSGMGWSAEERADRVLTNGARFYNDHGHPEYATPECLGLMDLVAQDRAGELIVAEAGRTRSDASGRNVTLYKNNTDYHGASYGTHESYLSLREVPPEKLISGLMPFLVTRQLFAGAGKVGVETGRPSEAFQMSQRADFMDVEASVDTLHRRPIVNTRDEPHAAASKWRRVHVIVGDANMSEWATAMKVGTTSLALSLLESGWSPPVSLADPVESIRGLSRSLDPGYSMRTMGGRMISAVELQTTFCDAATSLGAEDFDSKWVISEWQKVLADLSTDWQKVANRVDWAAKRLLFEQFMDETGIAWGDPMMQSLDLAYHDLNPEEGLFQGLREGGQVLTLVSPERVNGARSCAPVDTRAAIRGGFVRRFASAIRNIGWNGIVVQHNGEDWLIDWNYIVDRDAESILTEFEAAVTLADVMKVFQPVRNDT